MTTSQTIAQDVPFLRRYARALTGSQTSGDAYVTATLEALISDRSVLDDDAGSRVALFRLFTKIWSSLSVNAKALPEDTLRPGEQKLGNIMPLPRHKRSSWRSTGAASPTVRGRCGLVSGCT